jgi:hypothetical protein
MFVFFCRLSYSKKKLFSFEKLSGSLNIILISLPTPVSKVYGRIKTDKISLKKKFLLV